MARQTNQPAYGSLRLLQLCTNYRALLLTGLLLLVVIINLSRLRPASAILSTTPGHTSSLHPGDQAANSTLGFQKLLALSTKPSWRTRGLKAAADLVELDFTIPPQPKNSPELLSAFEHIGQDQGKKLPGHGSATAWMAHLDLLKYVIASELETALIVEDDVDFDVRLKDQIRLISDNVRQYTLTPEDDSTPYGMDWDVLWLGHCGSTIEDNMKLWKYKDGTRCRTELYSGWSKHYLRDRLEEDYRYIQNSRVTVCTFAYGVNRRSAPKLLSLLGRGADEAYDVSMSSYCSSGELNCIIVNPQVFNHYEPPQDLGYVSPVHIGDGLGAEADEEGFETHMGTTGNIMRSARCESLFNDVCMRPPSEI